MIPLYEGEVICLKFLVVTTLKPHKEVVNSNINEHTSTLQIPFKNLFYAAASFTICPNIFCAMPSCSILSLIMSQTYILTQLIVI